MTNKKTGQLSRHNYLTFSSFNKEVQRNRDSFLLQLLGELSKVQGVLDLEENIRQIVYGRLATKVSVSNYYYTIRTLFESKVV